MGEFKVFPECVARVPVSLWGSGVEGVFARRCPTIRTPPQPFATVRNRSQPSATVRNRSHEGRLAVPMESSTKGVTFGCFQRHVAAFRVAGVALCDIPTCLIACRKSFCVAGAILMCSLHKIPVAVLVAGAALWTCPSSFYMAGAALQTCRVACFLRIAVSGLRQVAPRCKFRGRRGIFCVAGVDFLRGRRTTYVSFCTRYQLQLSWQAQHFGDLCRPFAWQAQHSTLHTLHSTLHSTLYTSHSTLYIPHIALYTPHSTL